MNFARERVRLAMTAFDDPERLWHTLDALLKNGIAPEHMCLMARPGVLVAACRLQSAVLAPEQAHKLVNLCSMTKEFTITVPAGERTIAASAGPLLDLLLRSHSRAPIGLAPTDDDRRSLEELAHDDVLLVVLSSQPRQQLAATRSMLAGSLRSVTTHEFVLPVDQTAAAPARSP